MKILLILTVILGITSCASPSDPEKQLIGTWVLVEETDTFSDDIEKIPIGETDAISDPATKSALKSTITFNKDKTIFINQMGNEYDATYELTDSILTLGFREYIIVEIDKKKLIYKNKDGLFNTHYEFKKVE